MRSGFTTGSCAAAAAKAAAAMLLGGSRMEQVRILTPAGIPYETAVLDICIEEQSVSCSVQKDAGDDPDITDGVKIFARVEAAEDGKGEVTIAGGEGVGIVTRPGLDRPVGDAAINSTPRKMITDAVRSVMELFDYRDSLLVTIFVPGGKELAQKTFNPRLGIEGGISIIGTSGIVEPMSTKALLDTIRLELKQKKTEGAKIAVVSPGNYGLQFMKEHYGYDLEAAVKCANYIGETIDMVCELGFEGLLLVGHVGKLIKVSGGIMNTHSKEADCRMELMAAAAFLAHASIETIDAILNSVSTEEAYGYLDEKGLGADTFSIIMERIAFYLQKRAQGKLETQCIVYSNRWGLLGTTEGAEAMMERVKEPLKEKKHD
ncbi:MAG: cobalamin biosynthesis protein CbiD [Lachnospiraceae bacterium]|nr:cobalamin biosynthesis protein CbiD [Lachnospiraceae bacterium]